MRSARHAAALGLVFLSACAPQIEPADTSAVVRLYSGGAFNGYSESELFPDDVMRVTTTGPFGEDKKTRNVKLAAGAFTSARDYIFAHPIPAGALHSTAICDDYGADIVSYKGPDSAVDYRALCPNERLGKLYRELGAVIDSHRIPAGK